MRVNWRRRWAPLVMVGFYLALSIWLAIQGFPWLLAIMGGAIVLMLCTILVLKRWSRAAYRRAAALLDELRAAHPDTEYIPVIRGLRFTQNARPLVGVLPTHVPRSIFILGMSETGLTFVLPNRHAAPSVTTVPRHGIRRVRQSQMVLSDGYGGIEWAGIAMDLRATDASWHSISFVPSNDDATSFKPQYMDADQVSGMLEKAVVALGPDSTEIVV